MLRLVIDADRQYLCVRQSALAGSRSRRSDGLLCLIDLLGKCRIVVEGALTQARELLEVVRQFFEGPCRSRFWRHGSPTRRSVATLSGRPASERGVAEFDEGVFGFRKCSSTSKALVSPGVLPRVRA